MKKFTYMLTMIFLLTGCVNKNSQSPDWKTIPDHQSLTNLDTAYVSIVHPVVPCRIISVGGGDADVKGFTSQAIQTAIDVLKNSGGGTIKLMPGTYDIFAPVKLFSNMSLTGSGEKTILKKCAGFRSAFALDADYGELRITVSDASGFKPGMGVAIYDDDQRYGWDLTTARITDIKGNVIYINEFLLRDYRSDKNGTISNTCSVIEAVEAENVKISYLTVDGNAMSNDKIDGCRAGGIYLHKVSRAAVENVTVKNFNSDGISWQITENVTVRNCNVFGCTNSGLHPGTGSPFTLIEGNNSHDNGGYGLFVCWRVRNGVVRNNSFSRNGNNGICTGHKDTDMLFEGNHVFENGGDGIHLRGETALNAPHRSIFRKNLIENNGTKDGGYGFSMNCKAEGVVLEGNIIRNTGSSKQKAAVYLMKSSIAVKMTDNQISGHPDGEVVKE
jgi:hypothetical protein